MSDDERPLHDYKVAAELVEGAAQSVPGSSKAVIARGLVQFRLGLFQEAQATLEEADQLWPNRAMTLAALAMTALERDDRASAERWLARLDEIMTRESGQRRLKRARLWQQEAIERIASPQP